MTISEFHESTIIEVRAYFGFSEFDFNPEIITYELGIEPNEMMVKGEEYKLKNGKVMKRPFNSWGIQSKSKSKDINVHLRQLLEIIIPKCARIKEEYGESAFSVLWKGNYLYAGSGPFYEKDVLTGISKVGAMLYQDIYQIDQDDDETGNNLT